MDNMLQGLQQWQDNGLQDTNDMIAKQSLLGWNGIYAVWEVLDVEAGRVYYTKFNTKK
jgi:hypothetical protein